MEKPITHDDIRIASFDERGRSIKAVCTLAMAQIDEVLSDCGILPNSCANQQPDVIAAPSHRTSNLDFLIPRITR